MEQQGNFKRNLRKSDVWALALGAIIGWGCFVMPGTTFLPKAGPSAILGVLIGGGMMAVISLSYGYCIKKYPLSGGEFVYSDAAFGKRHSFVCGWMIVLGYWSLIPLNSTAIGLITRYLMPGVFQFGYLYTIADWDVYLGEVILSSALIILLGFLNVRGVKFAGWFQSTVAILLVASVLICFIGVLLSHPDFSNLRPFFAEVSDGQVLNKGIFACLIAIACYAPYCFVGFDCIPQTAEEYKFSHKASTGLMVAAILIGACIYAAVIFITAVVEPWGSFIASNPDWATGESVMGTLGNVGLFFLGIAMLCAVLSGMNAFYLAASRLLNSMSSTNALPRGFSDLHPKFGTPAKAIYFLMIFSLFCPWLGRGVLNWIVDMTCVGAAVGFTYTCAAATKMAKQDQKRRQMIIGIVGTALSAFFIILSFIPGSPGFLSVPSFIILAVWIVLGIVFWLRCRKDFLHGKWEGVDVEHILLQVRSENNKD